MQFHYLCHLFLFPTKNGINSPFISAMNKKIDVKGSINTIRHIIISSNLNSNLTPEERVDLAYNIFSCFYYFYYINRFSVFVYNQPGY